MTDQGRPLAQLVRDMIVERQRLLIREANYLRGLVGLPPVRADAKAKGEDGEQPNTNGRLAVWAIWTQRISSARA